MPVLKLAVGLTTGGCQILQLQEGAKCCSCFQLITGGMWMLPNVCIPSLIARLHHEFLSCVIIISNLI